MRITVVARDAELWRAGPAEMAEVLRARRGRAYDPAVAQACASVAPAVLERLDQTDPWQAMLDAVDAGGDLINDSALDEALSGPADFADLKSPWTRGHSPHVADLAEGAAREMGMDPSEAILLRQASLIHDLGRVGVPNGIWDRAGRLRVAEWERIRLHPHLTESTLACCPALEELGKLGGTHHERLDGSGYHSGRVATRPPSGHPVGRPQTDDTGCSWATSTVVRMPPTPPASGGIHCGRTFCAPGVGVSSSPPSACWRRPT